MIKLLELTNGVISVELLDYGATVKSIKMPDKLGRIIDVVLGYENTEEYCQKGAYFGATIGRVANRIRDGKFTLNGIEYNLNKKENQTHSMHGGVFGFDKKFWQVLEYNQRKVVFAIKSADGDEGYPAELNATVTYSLTENNEFVIEYSATTNGDTPVNFTNHSYFNLNGQGNGNIFDTEIFINSTEVARLDKDRVACGDIVKVGGSIFDFTSPKKIGNIFDYGEYMGCGYVYDVFYPISGAGLRHFATAVGDKSGIEMSVYSDTEGVHFYTEKFLEGHKVASSILTKGNAFCFETQRFPNAVNCENYPSILLKKGEIYTAKTIYKFLLKD